MQTIKTSVVVVLLIAVCYGAFIALNAPEPDLPDSMDQWLSQADIDMSGSDGEFAFDLGSAHSISPDAAHGGFELPNSSRPDEMPAFPEPDISLPETLPSVTDDSTAFPAMPAVPPQGDLAAGAADPALPPELDGPTIPLDNPPTAGAEPIPSNYVSKEGSEKSAFSSIPSNDPLISPRDTGLPSFDQLPLLPESPAVANSPAPAQEPAIPFEIAREKALAQAGLGELREALELLSPYYDSPELGHDDHADLVDILDALSRESIYSKRHVLEPAYSVQANDTVASVAEKHGISPELLASVNGLGASKALAPGSTLKVVRGPFRATVSIARGELTLFLGDLYAGRFPVSISKQNVPPAGVFEITDRRKDRTYYGPDGILVKADDPENPYGGCWLSLGKNLCIHGSPQMSRSDLSDAECIGLAPLDAADVYSILTKNSRVEIRR